MKKEGKIAKGSNVVCWLVGTRGPRHVAPITLRVDWRQRESSDHSSCL